MRKLLKGAAVVGLVAATIGFGATFADSLGPIDFEEPYALGNINGQDGWTKTGPYDVEVADVSAFTNAAGFGFDDQALRISNTLTSGAFGDQAFSPGLAQPAGELTGARHFEASFDIGSTQATQQPGLVLSVSPDDGMGSRMSYVRFEDQADGIHVFFDDVTNPGPLGNVATFNETDVVTLDRTQVHNIQFVIDFVPGPTNDVVQLYIDGDLEITGTTWEDYYRYDPEQDGNGHIIFPTSKLLFRAGGAAATGTLGNGFLIDHVQLSSSVAPVPSQTIVVTPDDMATSLAEAIADPTSWFFYNDENDTIDNSLGSFVTGPDTPPLGSGSVEISVTGTQRRNLATYQFSGTPLASITELKFSTFNPSAGNGGSASNSAYLQFNVDFDGSDTWQRRLLFLPSDNGVVAQDQWQEWDALDSGEALWQYSGPTWPGTAISGTTPRTWVEILASYPGVRIRVDDSWLGIRVGEPYPAGYTENLDAFVFGTAEGVTSFDFEPFEVVSDKDACKNGGWQDFTRGDGSPFKNQGDCIQYVNTGK